MRTWSLPRQFPQSTAICLRKWVGSCWWSVSTGVQNMRQPVSWADRHFFDRHFFMNKCKYFWQEHCSFTFRLISAWQTAWKTDVRKSVWKTDVGKSAGWSAWKTDVVKISWRTAHKTDVGESAWGEVGGKLMLKKNLVNCLENWCCKKCLGKCVENWCWKKCLANYVKNWCCKKCLRTCVEN